MCQLEDGCEKTNVGQAGNLDSKDPLALHPGRLFPSVTIPSIAVEAARTMGWMLDMVFDLEVVVRMSTVSSAGSRLENDDRDLIKSSL